MQKSDFGSGWRFARKGECLCPVSIPHDALLLEERKQGNPSGSGCAYFGGGCYEYEKKFTLPACESAVLLFEGIYPMGEITLDGEKAAFAHYGYGDCYVRDGIHGASAQTVVSYPELGTYFATVRVQSNKAGNANDIYRQILNLDRVRIVAE